MIQKNKKRKELQNGKIDIEAMDGSTEYDSVTIR